MSTAALRTVVGFVRCIAERDTAAPTDRQLLERFNRQQDEAAFAELVRRHGPMVLSTCRRVLRHEQDAEDAFQAAFLVLVRKSGSIRESDSIGGWLFQVAYRLAVRARVVGERRRDRYTSLTEEVAAPERTRDTLRLMIDEELQRLPEAYRAAVVLCYLEGRTQREAARLLTTTADAINSRLKRARERLRARLVRRGLAISAVAVGAALADSAARGAPSPEMIGNTAALARQFLMNRAPSSAAVALAKGALHGMFTRTIKILSIVGLVMALFTVNALLLPAQDDPPGAALRPALTPADEDGFVFFQADRPKPAPRACIILWMGGGPSQIDTWDPKPNHPNGGLFPAVNTNVKDVQISATLPLLARQMNHLAILRTVSHRDGSHDRSSQLMRTGYEPDGATEYPTLGSVLAKEITDLPDVPRYVSFGGGRAAGYGPGFLGEHYGPLFVQAGGGNVLPTLPAPEAFEKFAKEKEKRERMRQAVERAIDLKQEKDALRDAYGRNQFGQSCLLARRLIEQGVPIVEVPKGGWDTHGNANVAIPRLCGELDAGFATLLKDLNDHKLLDSTLIVCMGEFGRTPRINANMGRDHWPMCFSVVLAGRGIKGGQVIGKTSADGTTIDERSVSPAELYATIYKALGVDPAKENTTPTGRKVPLVEKDTKPVKEALR